jgi:tetratricopeptide (TPR) repeat protein
MPCRTSSYHPFGITLSFKVFAKLDAVRAWVLAAATAALLVPRSAMAEDAATVAYNDGRRLYDLGEWDKAIEKFKEAYKLRPDAPSLYNIAQAYRLKGDCLQAWRSYKTYKRNFPKAPKLDKVDKFIAELEPCAKQQEPSSPPVPTEPPPSTGPQPAAKPPSEPSPQPEQPDRSRPLRTAFWITAGTSVVLVGVGAAFGLRARSAYDEYQTTTDQARYFELRDQITGDALLANIGFISGGIVAAAAVTLFIADRGENRALDVAIDPTANGVYAWGRF